jgi:hypothetical protein
MASLRAQLRSNVVALVSLVVALSALGYNTWRNERTEHNRNVRVAGIEMLKEIGSLQQIIFYARFAEPDPHDGDRRDPRGDPRLGWVVMLTITDLAVLMPPDVVREAERLRSVWEANVARLTESDEAFARIDGAIDALRQTTLAELRALR